MHYDLYRIKKDGFKKSWYFSDDEKIGIKIIEWPSLIENY